MWFKKEPDKRADNAQTQKNAATLGANNKTSVLSYTTAIE